MDLQDVPRAFTVLACLFALLAVNFNAAAGSTWTEAGSAFYRGDRAGTTVKESALQLDNNSSYIGTWTKLSDGLPSARAGHSLVYDSLNGVAVLFGGTHRSDQEMDNETWTYNFTANSWTHKNPACSPRGRYGHAMAFDSANGVFVLFGGYSQGDGLLGDTWTYNLSADKWTEQKPAISPPPRAEAAMTYDAGSGVTVLFGGNKNGRQHNDTWTYDANANTWTNRTTPSGPSARAQHAMVYDSRQGVSLMFGGGNFPEGLFCDTWTYVARTNAWKNMQPASYPAARNGHAMAYDVRSGVIVIYSDDAMFAEDETWTYNLSLNAWTEMRPSPAPPSRYGCALIGDPVNGGCILFGGLGDNGIDTTGTWSYWPGNNSWSRKEDPFPCPRTNPDMVYDSANHVVVLFSGETELGAEKDDTWTYDLISGKWTEKKPANPPPGRQGHAMAYDSADGLVVLFGGLSANSGWNTILNDTWTYNLSRNTWTQRTPATAPSARYGHRMAYDSARGTVVLFGGGYGGEHGDVWTYNVSRNVWTQMGSSITSSPSMRYAAAMTYDPARALVILYGGYDGTVRNDTWTYNAGTDTWLRKDTAAPRPREFATLAFDADNRVAILFGGGVLYQYPVNETWTYDLPGNTWGKKSLALSPKIRWCHAMAYDDASRGMVLFGGAYGDGDGFKLGDTWVYDLKVYGSSGNYTSAPLDTKGNAYFGAIRWDALTSQNAKVKFRIRTANTSEELGARPFLGPNGKTDIDYSVSGQKIAGCHDGDRWIQYRACLATSNQRDTPVLKNVTVEYNLLHAVNLTSPVGGERWCGVHPITWTLRETDGDKITFDLYLLDGTGSKCLAANLPFGSTGWEWDASDVTEGTYRIKVVARDVNLKIPLSAEATSGPFDIYTNYPPAVNLSSPGPGAVVRDTRVELAWNGSDPNGDRLNYSVFISQGDISEASLPGPETVTAAASYMAQSLMDGKTYRWAVMANDGRVNGSLSEVRAFTVKLSAPNSPPSANLLSPGDNAVLNDTAALLSWQGSDPDGDTVSFCLMLSAAPFDRTGPPVPLAATCESRFLAGNLVNGTLYHWAVLPSDGKVNGSLTEVRRFRIDIGYGNHPPRFTGRPPDRATVGHRLVYNVTAEDEDGDAVDFSIASGPDGAEVDAASGTLSWTPRPDQIGSQAFRLLAADRRGGVSELWFTVLVAGEPPFVPKPGCTIKSPLPDAKVSGRIFVLGTATPSSTGLAGIEVRIDAGQWMDANGTTNWTCGLDTIKLKNGPHRIEARAFDGVNRSDSAVVAVTVNNPGPGPQGKGLIAGFEAVPAICAMAIILMIRLSTESAAFRFNKTSICKRPVPMILYICHRHSHIGKHSRSAKCKQHRIIYKPTTRK